MGKIFVDENPFRNIKSLASCKAAGETDDGALVAVLVEVDLALEPNLASSAFGRFHKFALNLARLSSRETACRNVRTMVLDVVNGNRLGTIPTESTVSLLFRKRLISFHVAKARGDRGKN